MSESLGSTGSADAHLPPFSTFGEMGDEHHRILTADARLLDPGWEYYERGDTVSIIASQAQYRPWEPMPLTVNSKDAILRTGFSTPIESYHSVTLQPIPNKLPSFQSQFQTFPESTVIPETGLPSVTPVPVTASPTPSASPSQLTQLTQLTTPSSPHLTTLAQVAPLSTTLTTLSPVNATTFHTLTAVNPRSYPIVPAPLQARELAPAGQTYIDDRHIQLYQPNITTINAFPTQNGIIHQNGTLLHQNGSLIQNIQSPTVVHVLKNEPFDMKSLQEKYTPNGLHHSNFQSPMLIENEYERKTNGFSSGSPTRSDYRKKERRKIRANSSESDGSNMDIGSESSGQVAAISSTAGFKSPMHGAPPMNQGPMDLDDISSEKQTKKKRKRCGECIGCQRKDNCGDCAPCRNDKSHQICKQRRCEKLTEKKLILAPDGTLQTVKSESRRGRGRGRGATTPVLQDIKSYRGRKPLGGTTGIPGTPGISSPGIPTAASPSPAPQAPAAPSPAPGSVATMKQDHPGQQTMAPMSFYTGDPNRFTTWQADPTQGWQNQFIQQLPAQTGQTTLDYQSNHTTAYATTPHYQTGNATYTVQNVATFDASNNTYYQTGVQAVTTQRPPSNRGAYTPVPSPRTPQHYTNEYQQQYASQASTPVATTGNDSRPPSAASYHNSVPTSGAPVYTLSQQNTYEQHNDESYNNGENGTTENHSNDDGQNDNSSNNQHSGNAEPGYLQGSNRPQASLDCSGYSGTFNSGHDVQQYENQSQNQNEWQQNQWQNNQNLQNHQQQMQHQQNHMNNQQQIQNQLQHNQDESDSQNMYTQNDRLNLNSRLKTMILNKQSNLKDSINTPPDIGDPGEGPPRLLESETSKIIPTSGDDRNNTGHFLSYSHHLRDNYRIGDQVAYSAAGNYARQIHASSVDEFGGGGHHVWKGGVGINNHKNQNINMAANTMTKLPTYMEMRTQYNNQHHNISQEYARCTNAQSDTLGFPNQQDNKDFQSQMLIGPVSETSLKNAYGNEKHSSAMSTESAQTFQTAPLIPKTEKNDNNQYASDGTMIKMEPSKSHNYQTPNMQRQELYNPYQNSLTKRSDNILPPISTIKHESYVQNIPQPQFPLYQYSDNKQTPDKNIHVQEKNVGFRKYTKNNSSSNSENLDAYKRKSASTENTPAYYIEQIKSENSPPRHKIYKSNFNQYPKTEPYAFRGEGGPRLIDSEVGYSCCRQGSTKKPPPEHLRDGACPGLQTKDEIIEGDVELNDKTTEPSNQPGKQQIVPQKEKNTFNYSKEYLENLEKLKNNSRTEVPDCNCFPADKNPPEPGSYYTHLGTAASLPELRKDLEARTGLSGQELRIEKICYTGKEGKSAQGCPMAKWVIRRTNFSEKVLVVVKNRTGHHCSTSWIVVCLVAWEGIPQSEADLDYTLLSHKLNRYGLPTTRRCATNENRTCACQGLDPETCGASYSFGCSWSMYYNGCKYARSKTVRKFRLSVKTEESEIEERMHVLATLLSPLYMNLAPKSFDNQCQFEKEASDCRLGFKPGRPFSGVTACIDFCAHAHRDLHNMNNGCTAVVTLAKHRNLSKPNDEQLHVLPLYVLDTTDEFGSKDGQDEKVKSGALEILDKYPMEVKVRSVPLQPCRRHGKKRKDEDTSESGTANSTQQNNNGPMKKSQQNNASSPRNSLSVDPRNVNSRQPNSTSRSHTPTMKYSQPSAFINNPAHYNSAFVNNTMHSSNGMMNPNLGNPALLDMANMIDNFTDVQLQSNQISSTVLDSPYNSYEQNYNIHHQGNLYNPNMTHLVEGNTPLNPNQLPGFSAGVQKKDENLANINSNANVHPANNHVNNWPDLTNPEIFPNIKEDPDSTTAHLNMAHHNFSPDSNRSDANSENLSTKSGSENERNTSSELTQKSFHEFDVSNSPRISDISQKAPSTPASPASSQLPDLKSPNSSENSNDRRSVWKSPDYKSLDSTKTKEVYNPTENENSLFRIPKARPPSRSNHNPDGIENTTFLKPYPRTDQRPLFNQSFEQGNAYDPRNTFIPNSQAQTSQSNYTINHEEASQCVTNKTSLADYPGNYYSTSQNSYTSQASPVQTYGNYSQVPNTYPFPPNPYGHIHPYENTYNDYNSLAYYNAEKIKREEFLRNAHCYSSYGYQYNSNIPPNFYQNSNSNWCQTTPNWCLYPPSFSIPYPPEPPKAEPIGEVTEFTDNLDCFKDNQMGGVAIALGHGSVLFECAKHEMHSTTAVKTPNRVNPTRISLVFYQHRNLNRPKHGLEEWEEKMRLKRLGLNPPTPTTTAPLTPNSISPASTPGLEQKPMTMAEKWKSKEESFPGGFKSLADLVEATKDARKNKNIMMRTETQTTMSWTTLFPMHPCTVTGPYQEAGT